VRGTLVTGKPGKAAVPPAPEIMDWDFATADTQELTHGLHYYPARMVPQIAARLLDLLWNSPTLILDPFAGSGTTLLEALLRRHRTIGIDVNPVANYLARAKCTIPETPIDVAILQDQIDHEETSIDLEVDPLYLQAQKNIDYWYERPVAEHLLAIHHGIRNYLDVTEDQTQQWVLWVTLMATVYACSRGTQDGSSFHTRGTLPSRETVPVPYFTRKLVENIAKIGRLAETFASIRYPPIEGSLADVLDGSTRATFNLTLGNSLDVLETLPEESIGGVITSPPYGDEHSTVNYTRYTKHAAFWFGLTPAEVKQGSGETLSSRKLTTLPDGIHETENVLGELRRAHELDSEKVVHFLSEFHQVLSSFHRILTPGAGCAIVIANRRVRQVNIPMDLVTSELAASAGFSVEKIYYRTFPKKVVAWTTISGSSMDQENIIILRK